MELQTGIEPATYGLRYRCSASWAIEAYYKLIILNLSQ